MKPFFSFKTTLHPLNTDNYSLDLHKYRELGIIVDR